MVDGRNKISARVLFDKREQLEARIIELNGLIAVNLRAVDAYGVQDNVNNIHRAEAQLELLNWIIEGLE